MAIPVGKEVDRKAVGVADCGKDVGRGVCPADSCWSLSTDWHCWSPEMQSPHSLPMGVGTPFRPDFCNHLCESKFAPCCKTEERGVGSLLVSAKSCPHMVGSFLGGIPEVLPLYIIFKPEKKCGHASFFK